MNTTEIYTFCKKGKSENCFFFVFFFPRMEVKESSFIIDNNGSLISQCQQIQYEAEQPQHHLAIKKYELN